MSPNARLTAPFTTIYDPQQNKFLQLHDIQDHQIISCFDKHLISKSFREIFGNRTRPTQLEW